MKDSFMFDIGGAEIIVVLIIALLVMGPKNLPKVARTVGRFMGHARRVTDEFKSVIGEEIRAMEMKEFQEKQNAAGDSKDQESDQSAGDDRATNTDGPEADPDRKENPAQDNPGDNNSRGGHDER